MRHCDPSRSKLYKRHSCILDLLTAFERTSSPSAEEVSLCGDSKWANTLLPFQRLIQTPEVVVSEELCLDSLERLLPIARCLDLNIDALHVQLADKLAAGDAKPEHVAQALQGISGNDLKLETAERLALAASNANTKVAGLCFALSMAQDWHASFPADSKQQEECMQVQATMERLASAVAAARTHQTLVRAGRGHLLEGAPSPAELLQRLCDEHTPHNAAQRDAKDSDFLKLFDEVAKHNDLDAGDMRHRIIKQWLHKGASASIPTATPRATPARKASCLEMAAADVKAEIEEATVRRIVFLMGTGDVGANARMLYLYAHSNDITVPTKARTWAMRALLVAASAGVGGLSIDGLPSPVDEMLQRLRHLRHEEALEELQIPITIEELETCSKPGLVRSLWKERGTEGGVARLVCEMCLDYSVHDVQLWGEVLAKLSADNEVVYLLGALKRVMQLSFCHKIPKLSTIWQATTAAPLSALQMHSGELPDAAKQILSLAVDLACSAPLDPLPDMRPAVELLLQNNQGELAIRCMLVISDSKQRKEVLTTLLDAGLGVAILRQLPPYQAQTGKTRWGLQSLTRQVYQHIDEHGGHLGLYNCSAGHQKAFLAVLLTERTIANALRVLLGAARLEEALGLFMAHLGSSAAGWGMDQKIAALTTHLSNEGCHVEVELLKKMANTDIATGAAVATQVIGHAA